MMTLADFQAWLRGQKTVAILGGDLYTTQHVQVVEASELLKWITPEPGPVPAPAPAPTQLMRVTEAVRIRQTPSLTANILDTLAAGTKVKVGALVSGFYKLADREGYSAAAYFAPADPDPTPPQIGIIPPKTASGIGAHSLGAWEPGLAQYPVFKAVDYVGAVEAYHAANPSGVAIFRRYYPESQQASFIAEAGGPAAAARHWLDYNLGDIQRLPYAYHEGLNECEPTPEMIEFEYQRTTLLASRGFKACVLNLAVGHTSDDLWKREDVKRLLALVQQYGGIVGLHCYAEGIMSSNCGPYFWKPDGSWSVPNVDPLPNAIDPAQCWLALRIIRDQQIIRQQKLNPTLVATELGIDDCVVDGNGIYRPHGIPTRGWRSCLTVWQAEGWLRNETPENFYRRQLLWWAEQTGLLGCVYAHNDTTVWQNITGVFDTRGVL